MPGNPLKLTSKKLRAPSRRKSLLLIVLLAVAGAGWLAVRSLYGPAVGEVQPPSQGLINEKPTYHEQDGKYVVFNYPQDYKPQPASRNQPNILETYTYQKDNSGRVGSLSLSISVYQLSGKLDEDGAYRLRKERPEQYQSRLTSVNGQVFTIFKKHDGSETVAFTANKNLVATIAISGTLANNNQSEAEFSALLNSWVWKN